MNSFTLWRNKGSMLHVVAGFFSDPVTPCSTASLENRPEKKLSSNAIDFLPSVDYISLAVGETVCAAIPEIP